MEPNVTVVGVEGSSDDLDVPMEACFRDAAFKKRHSLGSVNSVNVVRLLVQSAHFFFVYLRLRPEARGLVEFAVPCGAGGHLAAGLLALQMGLPGRLVAATNANDALHRLLSNGVLMAGVPTKQTVSPSMDIQVPYNVWRLLYVASGGNGAAVRRWQEGLSQRGVLEVPFEVRAWVAQRVRSVAVDDDVTLATMRSVRAVSGYMLDPHTAVGVAAACHTPFASPTAPAAAAVVPPVICMGCAHAVKFLPTVARALGMDMASALAQLPDRTHRNVAAVRAMAQLLLAKPADATVATAPPGCTTVFRRGEDWEARLRALLETIAPPHPPQHARL